MATFVPHARVAQLMRYYPDAAYEISNSTLSQWLLHFRSMCVGKAISLGCTAKGEGADRYVFLGGT